MVGANSLSSEEVRKAREELAKLKKEIADAQAQLTNFKNFFDDIWLTGQAMPKSKNWGWRQISIQDKVGNLPFTLKSGQDILIASEGDLLSDHGYLHSLDLAANSGNLFVELVLHDKVGGTISFGGTLSDFRLAGFDENMVMAGDPVVRSTGAVPEWVARVGPSFYLPFSAPFAWRLKNKTQTDIVIYSHDIYFIMILP